MAKTKKKELVKIAKLQFLAGKAKPGPTLAGLGIVMPQFTKAFNDATKDRGSEPVPFKIWVYKDKSFDFKLYTSPASYKLMQKAKITKGSSNAKKDKIATIQMEDLKEIAEYKIIDLNTDCLTNAMKIVAGTAKNMGIEIEGYQDFLEKNIKSVKKEVSK